MTDVAAHTQIAQHRYTIHFPGHAHREGDPHYRAFEAYRRKLEGTPAWVCRVGAHLGDFSECDHDRPLELHHAVIEFALANAVELSAIQQDFPDVQTEEALASFVESDRNLMVLCAFHHRGHAGVHTASYADWEASLYIKGLLT